MTVTVSSRNWCGKLSVCYTEMQARYRGTSSLKRSKWKWEKASLVQAMLSLAKENGSGVRLRWPRQCWVLQGTIIISWSSWWMMTVDMDDEWWMTDDHVVWSWWWMMVIKMNDDQDEWWSRWMNQTSKVKQTCNKSEILHFKSGCGGKKRRCSGGKATVYKACGSTWLSVR